MRERSRMQDRSQEGSLEEGARTEDEACLRQAELRGQSQELQPSPRSSELQVAGPDLTLNVNPQSHQ